METAIVNPSASETAVVKTSGKKKLSALAKIKRALVRLGNSNFSKRVSDAINSLVSSSWSMGRTVGRLCWVGGCYAIILLFPLAMEIDREQTIMEIQNRERERMLTHRRP
ncbi:hypothetical protein WA556_003607 [Blastocystis sp. ATCC 50177/Nand II]